MRFNPRAPGRAPQSSGPLSTRPATMILAMMSFCGIVAWASLSFLRGGSAMPPGLATFTGAWSSLTATYWGAAPAVGSPYTGTVNGSLTHAQPLHCDNAGLSSFGSPLTIGPTEVVCGDVLVVGGDANIQGEIRGSLQVIGGSATISGVVTGDISVAGGDVTVQTGGEVDGATHALGGSVLVAPNATVRDLGVDLQSPRDITRPPGLGFSVDVGSFWLSLLFWLSATLGVTLFAPEMVGQVRSTVTRHFWLSGTIGLVGAVVSVVVAVALVFTCLGIPLALLIGVAAWAGWVVGTVGVGAWLGSVMFGGPMKSHQPSLMASALLGATVLCILKSLPVAGVIIGLLVGAVALGAALITLLSAHRTPAIRRSL